MAQKYGSTVKNLTLGFSPEISGGVPIHIYMEARKKFWAKKSMLNFHGRPVLLGHVFRGTLKKCRFFTHLSQGSDEMKCA